MLNWLPGKFRMWRFESLADFARVAHWLEMNRRNGQQYSALNQYLRFATPMLKTSIDEYLQCVEQLDVLAEGIFSGQPGTVSPGGERKISAPRPLQTLQRIGTELRNFFETLQAQENVRFTAQWLEILHSKREYYFLLRRLVGDFGNFEALVPMLPATGPKIIDPEIQQLLNKMYEINTRNLRILELIYDTCLSWRKDPTRANFGFIEPRTYCNQLIGSILLEYMIEADPIRIRNRQSTAGQENKPFAPYRFWRPAENLKLMSQVAYSPDELRKPVATRKYVELQLDYIPPICVDLRRLQWSLREIFNNCLAASSSMYIGPTGKWTAHPLARHDCKTPSPAIVISLEKTFIRRGWRKTPTLKLVFRDEGTGIAPQHLPYLTLWGYSPRRAEFLRHANKSELFRDRLGQEIRIGGKGIGLAYATAVIREHGGEIKMASTLDEGTCVTVNLPVPTTLPV